MVKANQSSFPLRYLFSTQIVSSVLALDYDPLHEFLAFSSRCHFFNNLSQVMWELLPQVVICVTLRSIFLDFMIGTELKWMRSVLVDSKSGMVLMLQV